MLTLNDLEQCIFDVDGVRVTLRGNTPVSDEYWKIRFKANGTVAEFKARFCKRYPCIDIVVFNGVGTPAHGNYLMKNLRATYEFAWIKNEHEDVISAFQEIVWDQQRTIKGLKKALRKSSKPAVPEKEPIDPYGILDVSPDASDAEVKQAHRKRIQVFHPDRFSTMDALVIDFVNEKAQQINLARDEIARQRAEANAS